MTRILLRTIFSRLSNSNKFGCIRLNRSFPDYILLAERTDKTLGRINKDELVGTADILLCLIYMALQLAVSLGFIYLCPLLVSSCGLSLVAWHWIYLAVTFVLLAMAYVLFKKKYYHLHEEYLSMLKKR